VVNVDDEYGRRLVERLDGALTYGEDESAEVRPEAVELDDRGIRGSLRTPRGAIEVASPLLGRYNLSNILAAVAVAEALRLPFAAIASGLAGRTAVAGRLERVDRGQSFPVAIDFAHTPAALEAALESARELWGESIVLVFGCGGERDPGKRPLMGRVAGELAAVPILTADNPRGEDPDRINAAVEVGLRQSGNWDYRVIPDRREAIREAVRLGAATPGAAVLVAGKGHEEAQIVGDEVLPFSDRGEVEQALEELVGRAPRA
jgi:UDP-N-acetylmuramoyl-L-alanyl-D-glutamate--2,6-diaminopimelate ligase